MHLWLWQYHSAAKVKQVFRAEFEPSDYSFAVTGSWECFARSMISCSASYLLCEIARSRGRQAPRVGYCTCRKKCCRNRFGSRFGESWQTGSATDCSLRNALTDCCCRRQARQNASTATRMTAYCCRFVKSSILAFLCLGLGSENLSEEFLALVFYSKAHLGFALHACIL